MTPSWVPSLQRGAGIVDAARFSFGLPTALSIVIGIAAGFGVSALDAELIVDIPVFSFDTQDAARGLLETVATVTVAVAGLAFSVTIVAFTLASHQLSPRVLRSFRGDRLVQLTLATFIGTFIYCLVVLVRLGAVDSGNRIPNLSITLAVVFAIVSFALFAAFIAHIITMLQPSSVIEAIRRDAADPIDNRYPGAIGKKPEDPALAASAVSRLPRDPRVRQHHVAAEGAGYLTLVAGDALVKEAARCDAVVWQRVPVGDYVLPGDPLAAVCAGESEDLEKMEEAIRDCFILGRQRTHVQDPGFAVRQLADVALKGLSPGINDPTTAQNAMEALTAVLLELSEEDPPSPVRADDEGLPRFVAQVPTLADLTRLGFEQVEEAARNDRRLAPELKRLRAKAASGNRRVSREARSARDGKGQSEDARPRVPSRRS